VCTLLEVPHFEVATDETASPSNSGGIYGAFLAFLNVLNLVVLIPCRKVAIFVKKIFDIYRFLLHCKESNDYIP